MNTYADAADVEADRAQQLHLLAALGGWERALRRDELAAWCINGTRGRIYTDGRSWVMHVACRSARHWSAVRVKLATFATITVDGDDESVARLHDLPAPAQAEVIREALGIRVAVSTAWRERLRLIGFGARSQEKAVSAPGSAWTRRRGGKGHQGAERCQRGATGRERPALLSWWTAAGHRPT